MATVGLARWIAGLLVVSGLLFGYAVSIERSAEPRATETHAEASPAAASADEPGEAEGGGSAEELLGINLENPIFIWGFVVLSLAVAAGAWLSWQPAVYAAIVLAGPAAILDVREVLNQRDMTVLVLAALILFMHVATVILAVTVLRRRREA
ncbi:MAG TPA: hypothetical protein VFB16_01455 [Bauldia sp.]|nr:hypothetical protein [Bauldia sp.]